MNNARKLDAPSEVRDFSDLRVALRQAHGLRVVRVRDVRRNLQKRDIVINRIRVVFLMHYDLLHVVHRYAVRVIVLEIPACHK